MLYADIEGAYATAHGLAPALIASAGYEGIHLRLLVARLEAIREHAALKAEREKNDNG